MNHIDHKLTHAKAMAAGLTVVRHPAAIRYEVEAAARALERASIVLRSVPRYPENEDVLRSYQEHYDQCVADMREALSDA